MISRDTAKHSILVLSSNFFKVGFGFLTTLLLASGLGPMSFGIYSQIVNIALILAALSDLGVNMTFVRQYSIKLAASDAGRVEWLRGVFTIRLLLGAGVALIALLGLPPIAQHLMSGEIPSHIIRISCLLIVSEGVFSFLLAYFQAGEKFTRYALINPLPNVIRLSIIGTLFLVNGLTYDAVIIAIIIAGFTTSAVSVLLDTTLRLKKPGRKDVREFVHILSWGKWLLIQGIANTIMVKLDLILLGYFNIDSGLVGNYALALYFASLVTILQTTLITVLLPRVSIIRSYDSVREYLGKCIKIGAIIITSVFILGIVGEQIIQRFYGASYPYAPPIFLYLIGAFGVSFMVTPVTILAFTINQPQILAFQNIVAAVIVFGAQYFLIPQWGIVGAAVSVIIARVISEAFAAYMVIHRLPRHRFEGPVHPPAVPLVQE